MKKNIQKRPTPSPSDCEVSSSDCVLRFALKRRPQGVHIERIEIKNVRSRIEHAMLFRERTEFSRFCSADSLRFTYPLVFQQLVRAFDGLFVAVQTEYSPDVLASRPDCSDSVLAIVQRVECIQQPEDMVDLLHIAKRAFGANHAAFVSFVQHDDSAESFRFLLACDPVWFMAYQAQGWYANDPWLLYAQADGEPICASRIPCRTNIQQQAVDLARQFGFRSAYVVPAPAAPGLSRLGLLVLGSVTDGFFESEASVSLKVLAQGLAMELHRWWVRRVRHSMIQRNRLTRDDLMLLELERDGLGTKEIADRLGLTLHAVNSKFQRLNTKLNTPNRKATARLAMEYGLIS